MVNTINLTSKIAQGAGMVGRVVTHSNTQHVIHSIEGDTWYAFQEKDGTVTIDVGLTALEWITGPVATIVPTGHAIGEGFSRTVPLGETRPGVCLVKSYR